MAFIRVFDVTRRLARDTRRTHLKLDTMHVFDARVEIGPDDVLRLLAQISKSLSWAQNEIPGAGGFDPEGRAEYFTVSVNGIPRRFQLARLCLSSTGYVIDVLARDSGSKAKIPIYRTLGVKCKATDHISLSVHFTYTEGCGIFATQQVALKRFTLESEDFECDCREALYLLG